MDSLIQVSEFAATTHRACEKSRRWQASFATLPAMANDTPLTPVPLSKAQTFFRRLASSLFLWGVVLTALFSGNRLLSDCVFLLLMTLLAVAGLVEFYN